MVTRRLLPFALLSVAVTAQDDTTDLAKPFEFQGQTLGGQTLDQSVFEQSVLIVDLWGTWCPPCREAVPHLVQLYQRYKHHGLEIVGFCYDRSGRAEDADTVRQFAADNKITYPLLPGDKAVRDLLADFAGYPTLLMFARGLKLEHTQTGFDAATGEKIERWVRTALGLDKDKAAPNADKEKVPAGKIFEPGNGDVGFEIDVIDVKGVEFSFESLRGAPVLLALTTSWDQDAARTAQVLEAARKAQPKLHVVAWHLERSGNAEEKAAAVGEFLRKQQVNYRAITSKLELTRQKIHRFASLPTLLLFDPDGVLVQRENGISDEISGRLLVAAKKLVEKAGS